MRRPPPAPPERTEAEDPKGQRVSDYDYELPPDRVARYPAARRDESRLMVLPPRGPVQHRRFSDLVELVVPGDLLVVNESRVIPARLLGRKPTGAAAEILLVRPLPDESLPAEPGSGPWATEARLWEALVRPGGKLKPGRRVVVADDLEVEIVDSLPSGNRVVRLETSGSVEAALERHGRMPLPPYIDRESEPLDRERYQTVYARTRGSIAAPTAGLHFTDSLLRRLEERGVGRAAVTLHVGVGTFRPVEGDDPEAHEMHAEWYDVPPETAALVNRVRKAGGRIWAVGTTAVRTLESSVDEHGRVVAGSGETRLFIRPPWEFQAVDALITNFHLPRSTLLMLVAALAGRDRVLESYREAVARGYRFYSYGDAMAILPGDRG